MSDERCQICGIAPPNEHYVIESSGTGEKYDVVQCYLCTMELLKIFSERLMIVMAADELRKKQLTEAK